MPGLLFPPETGSGFIKVYCMNKQRPLHLVLLCVPLFVLVGLFFYAQRTNSQKLQLIPNEYGLELWPWAENDGADSSRIVSFFSNERGIHCSYNLNLQAPYAGFTMNPSDKPFWDISEYDYVDIGFDKKLTESAHVTLSFFLDGFSKEHQWQTLRLVSNVFYSVDKNSYRIPFRKLTTPMWWYRENNVQKDSVPEIDYRQLANISFVNGEEQSPNRDHTIRVTSLTFGKNPPISKALLLWCASGYILGVLLLHMWPRRGFSLPKLKRLTVSNYADEEFERVSSFMGQNFQEKGLSLGQVSEQTGVSTTKITNLLKRFRGESYNQFLNVLRLEEAKRLLRETDRNVSEISALVGYGYVNSFNRVFKEAESRTPLEYRAAERVSS